MSAEQSNRYTAAEFEVMNQQACRRCAALIYVAKLTGARKWLPVERDDFSSLRVYKKHRCLTERKA